MSLWILDTDHLSLFERADPLVVRRYNSFNAEDIAITVISLEEQMQGRLNTIRRASSPDALVTAYARLRETADALKSFNLLDFARAACTRYEELRSQKIRIGTQDLRIAAIVLSVNGILVTRNHRDFARVPDLIWENWTIP